jgi:hypothetical protein
LAFFTTEPLNFAAPVLGIVDDLVLLPLLLRVLARLAAAGVGKARSGDDRVISIQ